MKLWLIIFLRTYSPRPSFLRKQGSRYCLGLRLDSCFRRNDGRGAVFSLNLIAVTTLLLSYPTSSIADECSVCKIRKKQLCEEECALVDAGLFEECRDDCISEYCEHKCSKASSKKTVERSEEHKDTGSKPTNADVLEVIN